ncbi:hypothetical protein A5758_02245 [Mycobacterium sp. 852014-50255_SCH5639931]|nr:hypothetical protein A5758_02245 [Mycobacterium sp. 852014-50255_SCH5639931]
MYASARLQVLARNATVASQRGVFVDVFLSGLQFDRVALCKRANPPRKSSVAHDPLPRYRVQQIEQRGDRMLCGSG